MFNIFNIINFANLPALLGLLVLPVIFYIIRLQPPIPKETNFSSFFLLEKFNNSTITQKKFPLWLLIFRLLLVFFIILFFSKPYINQSINSSDNTSNDYVVIADLGWSMSQEWEKTKKIIQDISIEAEKKNKNIFLYHTGLDEKDMPIKFNKSAEVNSYFKSIKPFPWQINETQLDNIQTEKNYLNKNKFFYIFSKFDNKNPDKFKKIESFSLKTKNSYIIDPIDSIIYIKKLDIKKDDLKLEISRKGLLDFKLKFTLIVKDIDNNILFKKNYTFARNSTYYNLEEKFPIDIINRMHKIEISNQNHAAAKYIFDDFSKKKKIGILSEEIIDDESPLLSAVYYLEKSLNPDNIIKVGNLNKLIEFGSSIIIVPNKNEIIEKKYKLLNKWILKGGTLIKFSGPRLLQSNSLFLSENNLSINVRHIGNELSFDNKLSILDFDENSIFKGLQIPNDIKFYKQLIINNYNKKISVEARLSDKTPLVSYFNQGEGKVFLFHVTANNQWSNLPLSSLFSEMLNRIVLLSERKYNNSSGNLTLTKELDGFGTFKKPSKFIIIKNQYILKTIFPSKDFVPGIYENKEITAALNLANRIKEEQFDKKFNNKVSIHTDYNNKVFDLSGLLLKLVCFLIILDMLITILLKSNLKVLNKVFFNKFFLNFAFFLFVYFNFNYIHSNQLANNTYLAYVKTSEESLDALSLNGLNTISKLLRKRTSISPKGVIGVNINKDKIFYYPFLYWPLSNNLIKLNSESISKIKNYFYNGGIILFDIVGFDRTDFSLNSKKYNEIKKFLSMLGISNLSQVTKDHTLTKSFYLLSKFPGKWDNKILLIDNNDLNIKDGVSSIILGFNNWASAWALDNNNKPLNPVVPGGERQRELSYRFAINVTVYALTGNYKADQIHTKSILKRLENSVD